MANKITLLDTEKITYEGVFDLKELYKHLYEWLAWRKYDISEKKYKEKVKSTGKDMEIMWEANKDIDEYSQFKIEMKAVLIAVNDVEVQKESGAKVKMQKGEISIAVSAHLITDRLEVWQGKPAFSFLQRFYEKYLYKGSIDRMKGELWKVGWDFYNEAKAFLNLYKFG